MKTNKLQTSNFSVFRIPRPKIPDSQNKMFATKLPGFRNLGTHTWGEITDQTYLANGINSDALPKEEENL